MKMQKLGGYSAIASVCILAAIIAIVVPFAVRYGLNQPNAGLDPAKVAAAYSGSPTTIWVASILEILGSILGLIVALALYERMLAKAPYMMRLLLVAAVVSSAMTITDVMLGIRSMAAMTGAADVSIYKPFLVMQSGLSTASDNVSGWVFLLIGAAALSTRALPRFVGWVFLILGILQVIGFALPNAMGTSGMVVLIIALLFGAVSTVWLGIVLLRAMEEPAPAKTMAAQASSAR